MAVTDLRASTRYDWEIIYSNPGDNLGLEVYPRNIYYPGNQIQDEWNVGAGRLEGHGLMVLAGPFHVPIFSLSARVNQGASSLLRAAVGMGGLDGGGKLWTYFNVGFTIENAMPVSGESAHIELISTAGYQELIVNGVPIIEQRGLTGVGGATDYVMVAEAGWVTDIELRAPRVGGWPV